MSFKPITIRTMLEFEKKYNKNMLSVIDSLSNTEGTFLTSLVQILSVVYDGDAVQLIEDNFDKMEDITEELMKSFQDSPLFKQQDNTPSEQ